MPLTAVAYLAQSPPAAGPLDVVSQFLGYGLLGVLAAMLVFQIGIVPRWTMDRLLEEKNAEIGRLRADKAASDEALDAANTYIRDVVVPAQTQTIEIARAYVEALRGRQGP